MLLVTCVPGPSEALGTWLAYQVAPWWPEVGHPSPQQSLTRTRGGALGTLRQPAVLGQLREQWPSFFLPRPANARWPAQKGTAVGRDPGEAAPRRGRGQTQAGVTQAPVAAASRDSSPGEAWSLWSLVPRLLDHMADSTAFQSPSGPGTAQLPGPAS